MCISGTQRHARLPQIKPCAKAFTNPRPAAKRPPVRCRNLHCSATAQTTGMDRAAMNPRLRRSGRRRSEEHTSELQSPDTISYAVFCLKKKNKDDNTTHATHFEN